MKTIMMMVHHAVLANRPGAMARVCAVLAACLCLALGAAQHDELTDVCAADFLLERLSREALLRLAHSLRRERCASTVDRAPLAIVQDPQDRAAALPQPHALEPRVRPARMRASARARRSGHLGDIGAHPEPTARKRRWRPAVAVADAANCSGPVDDPAQQRELAALTALFNSTGGPQWRIATGWLSAQPPAGAGSTPAHCSWFGVRCNACGRVTRVILVSNNLSGSLPAALSDLQAITAFDVHLNSISGTLVRHARTHARARAHKHGGERSLTRRSRTQPASLAAWSQLVTLDISSSALSGTLSADFAQWTALQTLALEQTRLSGSLAEAFSSWEQLRELQLFITSLSGTLTPAFSRWTLLEQIGLYSTAISGTLSAAFAAWTQLRQLDAFSTSLSGSLDASMAAWRQLSVIDVSSTQLSGTLDPAFSAWSELQVASFYSTRLSGTLDVRLADAWTRVQQFAIAATAISGSLPVQLANWSDLSWLTVASSSLSGTLDPAFAAWAMLDELSIASTQISGSLHPAFVAWSQLSRLLAAGSALSGTLGSEFSAWEMLTTADLSSTQLSGVIAAELGAWSQLMRLALSQTPLSGTLDPALRWGKLLTMDLSSAQLSGALPPPALSAWTKLSRLDLSGNSFSGTLPAETCAWGLLTVLDLSNNALTGLVPACQWAHLTVMDLSRNSLTGLSGGWLSLPNARVDLSRNAIAYRLSDCVGAAPFGGFQSLDLSDNRWAVELHDALLCLTGTVTGHSSNASQRAYVAQLTMDRMGLFGDVDMTAGLRPDARVSALSMAGNALTSRAALSSSAYGITTPFLSLSLANNSGIGASMDLGLFAAMAAVDVSFTNIAFCYESLSARSAASTQYGLLGVRPSSFCNRLVERGVVEGSASFRPCGAAPPDQRVSPASPAFLAEVFCRRSEGNVQNASSLLTCPAFSTLRSGGQARFAADSAFLGFAGCACPTGQFWGYAAPDPAALRALLQAEEALNANWWLGRHEVVLSSRTCLPCPVAAACSPLALQNATHRLQGSRYPWAPAALRDLALPVRSRALLVYAASLPCLHPEVCNREPVDFAGWEDWGAWAAAAQSGATAQPEAAEYQCREGHDPAARQCARCLDGHWADGFLCRRCGPGFAVLVPVLGVAALVAAACFVLYKVKKAQELDRELAAAAASTAAAAPAVNNSGSLVFWFLQVSATLRVSAQINAAQRGDAWAERQSFDGASGGLSWLELWVTLRPWAAECFWGPSWTFAASSAGLFALPWAVVVLLAALRQARRRGWLAASAEQAARWTPCALVALDMLYLPVSARVFAWFNVQCFSYPGDPQQVIARAAPACCALTRARGHAQCFLRLAPDVNSGTAGGRAMTAWAALTFIALTAGLPALCGWLLWRGRDTAWVPTAAVSFLLHPLRGSWFRALWVGSMGFGRRLLFAALVGLSDYAEDGALPTLVFCSLLCMLLLQVRAALRGRRGSSTAARHVCLQVVVQPYASASDNRLETVCLTVLLFTYFVSVVSGTAARGARSLTAAALAAEVLVVLYGIWTAAEQWWRQRAAGAASHAAGESSAPVALLSDRRASAAVRVSAVGGELGLPLLAADDGGGANP